MVVEVLPKEITQPATQIERYASAMTDRDATPMGIGVKRPSQARKNSRPVSLVQRGRTRAGQSFRYLVIGGEVAPTSATMQKAKIAQVPTNRSSSVGGVVSCRRLRKNDYFHRTLESRASCVCDAQHKKRTNPLEPNFSAHASRPNASNNAYSRTVPIVALELRPISTSTKPRSATTDAQRRRQLRASKASCPGAMHHLAGRHNSRNGVTSL